MVPSPTSPSTPHTRTPHTHDPEAGIPRHTTFVERAADYVTELESAVEPAIEGEIEYLEKSYIRFWKRLRGDGRRVPTWTESFVAVVKSSWLNILMICIPLAWISHFLKWNPGYTFALSLVGIIPLEKLFDVGSEELALYLGESMGDLVVITLDNMVEATLGILLLAHCELKLLQSTVIGVVLLHLLLIPGTAFLTGGARIWEQHLDPHQTELNHSLLTVGVMTMLIPVAFFASLDDGSATSTVTSTLVRREGSVAPPLIAVSDASRDVFLKLSRGLSIILLIIYVGSRVYLHNPPGEGNALQPLPGTPEAIREKERETLETQPRLNPGSCFVLLIFTVAILAPTAEWLVESIDPLRADIREEWFGLILLPIVSFSADAITTIGFFLRRFLFLSPRPPTLLAEGRAIDLSIQFTLFWMPVFVLLSWWMGRPLTILFDRFEVALVIGSCFLVNSVTQDAKTNWSEGLIMVSFYLMIALASWYYDGQRAIETLLVCESVSSALAAVAG